MTSRLELEKVLRRYTTDPELMAGFYEAAGALSLALVERKKVLKAMLAREDYAGAIRYQGGAPRPLPAGISRSLRETVPLPDEKEETLGSAGSRSQP